MSLRSTMALATIAALFASNLPLAAPVLAQDAAATPVSFTAAQVTRGKSAYTKSCADCHGAGLDDGEFGGAPLKGNAFKEKWFGMTADSLYGFMASAMPPDRPGRLTPQTYADLTAYILSVNGVKEGASELPGDLDKLSNLTIQ